MFAPPFRDKRAKQFNVGVLRGSRLLERTQPTEVEEYLSQLKKSEQGGEQEVQLEDWLQFSGISSALPRSAYELISYAHGAEEDGKKAAEAERELSFAHYGSVVELKLIDQFRADYYKGRGKEVPDPNDVPLLR